MRLYLNETTMIRKLRSFKTKLNLSITTNIQTEYCHFVLCNIVLLQNLGLIISMDNEDSVMYNVYTYIYRVKSNR